MKKLKKLLVRYIIRLSILLLLLSLALSTSSIIKSKQSLSPAEIKIAKDKVKELRQKFSSSNNFVELSLSQNDLDAIMAVASHTIPQSRFNSVLSPYGIALSASKKINTRLFDVYINVNCLLTINFDKFEIDYCDLGSIPLPGWLLKSTIQTTTSFIFGDEVEETLTRLIDSGRIVNNKIIFTTTKSTDFKNQVNASMKTAASVIRTVNNSTDIHNDKVQLYIEKLHTLEHSTHSLAYYIGKAFFFAQQRSIEHDPIIENTAALWALSIVYSNRGFSRLIGLENKMPGVNANTTLRGREDLKLHFLYSVILEQMGDQDLALNIGELKELLDSNKGGSGYSFSDLAADKAGALFSNAVTSSEDNAIYAQNLLANITNEDSFFPYIHDLPDGFKANEFERVFEKINSELYNKQEKRITDRINKLALYNSTKAFTNKDFNLPNEAVKNGLWLTIDTHIHTKYSDGNKTVAQIAKQANMFGCDAIAITDHGDYNLKKVATKEYFDVINAENDKYAYMTVIAGLEWNIPPFMGREHATVLLPKHINSQRDLKAFKDRYDSWGRRNKKLLDTEQAFKWLEKNAIVAGIKPVVIYNHPSRKDKQQNENKHDIEEWANYGDFVIGYTGAPGHQKNRSKTNGSYTYKHKTIHGWDPSIAKIGAEWDKLLQQGKYVWAARAPSDFHNPNGEYWPCQFSSTHLYSKSKEQNDILQALRAGNFWAQHGKFVQFLDFSVQNSIGKSNMGQILSAEMNEKVTVKLNINLNDKDWQGYPASLDDVELVIITPNGIQTKSFEPLMYEQASDKVFSFTYNHIMKSESAVFRWRGRSIQPELHHYMFYTNPIIVEVN